MPPAGHDHPGPTTVCPKHNHFGIQAIHLGEGGGGGANFSRVRNAIVVVPPDGWSEVLHSGLRLSRRAAVRLPIE